MVNSVNFGSYNNYPSPYVKESGEAAKYTYAAVNSQVKDDGPFSGMGTIFGIQGLISGAAGVNWLWKNRADVPGAWKIYKDAAIKQANIFKRDGGLFSKRAYVRAIVRDQIKTTKATKLATAQKAAKQAANAGKTGIFSKAGNVLKKLNPVNLLKKIPGVSKAGNFLKNSKPVKLLGKIPGVSKIAKMGKGNGIFLAVSAAIEVFTQIIPTFKQLGVKSGLKQIGKSAVTTVASVGGWVAGSAVGTKAGAALGAAIGSVVPGVGTAIGGVVGGVVGFMGGLLGSWLATKGAKAIVGKNELEKAQEAGTLPADNTALQQELQPQPQQPAQAEQMPFQLQPQANIPNINNPFGANNTQMPFQFQPQANMPNINNPFGANNTQMPEFTANGYNQGFNPYLFNNGNQLPYAERDFMAMTVGLG